MASLSSIAPCQHHHTSVLAATRNPSVNLTSRTSPRSPFVNLNSRAFVPASHVNGSASCRSGGGGSGGARSSIPMAVDDSAVPAALSVTDNASGIGIAEFYQGKNILIIGGTGFLAKDFEDKSDIGKIYVVVKAKDDEVALKRLQNEVVDTELFKCLQEIHGKGYQSFVGSKLVPVVGNVRESSVGIATQLANKIADEVDVIVNLAANTTFDERYDVAIDTNTLGPLRIISFAHRFKRLKLFLHVSTAYVNGQRQGVLLEEPLCLGDTIASRLRSSSDLSGRNNIVLDIEAEIKLAFGSRKQPENSASFQKEMKDLGIERAKLHGWENTYQFTKAMGEMLINAMRGQISVVTMRPSIIESTLKGPFPGWIQGNRVMDPMIVYYGKGHMSCILADPDCVVDMVPVDMVANAMISAIAKHGGQTAAMAAAGSPVYHVTSSTVNPLVLSDMLRFGYQHFSKSPLIDTAGRPILVKKPSTIGSIEEYVRYVHSEALLREEGNGDGMSPRRAFGRLRAKAIIHLGRIYQPFTFYQGRFGSANMEALFLEMSAEEKARFHFDMRSIDWVDYITNVHIPGLRKYIIKDNGQHMAERSPRTYSSSLHRLLGRRQTRSRTHS